MFDLNFWLTLLLALVLVILSSALTLVCSWDYIWNQGLIKGIELEQQRQVNHDLAQRRGYVRYLQDKEKRDG